jgi:hypothetical protein
MFNPLLITHHSNDLMLNFHDIFFVFTGAAVMNNTFVLGIFMLIIYFKELTWTYFAETASILFVIGCVGLMALKKTHTVIDGLLILSLYPISLLVVMALEAVGWN